MTDETPKLTPAERARLEKKVVDAITSGKITKRELEGRPKRVPFFRSWWRKRSS